MKKKKYYSESCYQFLLAKIRAEALLELPEKLYAEVDATKGPTSVMYHKVLLSTEGCQDGY